jgi:hypothetical protein
MALLGVPDHRRNDRRCDLPFHRQR